MHDACRPFVDQETILENIRITKEKGCAVAVVDLAETLIETFNGENASSCVPRDNLKRVMTPQSFRGNIIKDLLSSHDELMASKEPSIFAYYISKGGTVHCSPTSERNFKITYKKDLELFQYLAK